MKIPSLLLLCVAFVGGVANAALLPTPESGNPKILPDGVAPGTILPGGGSGGTTLPGGSGSGGDKVLPNPAGQTGGGDRFRDSTPIRLLRLVATDVGNNKNATVEDKEPFHGGYEGNPGGKSLWWRFQARFNGYLVISTAGSNFDTVLGVYTGESVDNLTAVAQDNDSGSRQTSLVSIRMLAGTLYHIAVDGYNGASGDIQLRLVGIPDPTSTGGRPANDDYDNAVQLVGTHAVDYGYNYGATMGPEDTFPYGFISNASVWWTWRAPASGRVTVQTAGSDFDTYLVMYNPSFYWGYIYNWDVDWPRDRSSILTANVREGEVFDIAVDGEFGALGFIVLTLDFEPSLEKPANDAFGFRKGIQGRSYSEETTNISAFWDEVDEPAHGGAFTSGSLWWTWTAPNSGVVTIAARAKPSTDPKRINRFKPVVAAYRGAELRRLKTISTAVDEDLDGYAETSFTVKKGEIYQLAVAAQAYNAGEFTFSLRYQDGSPALARQPEALEVMEGDTARFTIAVSSKTQTPVTYRWQVRTDRDGWKNLKNNTQISGVRTPTLTIKNVRMDIDGSRYRCIIKNKQGTQTSKPATLTVIQAPLKTQIETKGDKKKLLGEPATNGGKLLGN